MSHNILSGKKGLIFGLVNRQSLAYFVSQKCLEEGANIVLTNTESAIQLGEISEIASEWNVPVMACDASDENDIKQLLINTQHLLGGKIDFILHAVAMSQNLRRHRQYDETNYSYFHQTIDVSALSLHKCLKVAKQLGAITDGGSVVTLTYIASDRYVFGYNDMSDAKAMLESVVRNFGGIYGEENNVRINAVSQSPTPTKAGSQYNRVERFSELTDMMSPLGNATAQSCAELCVMLFSDYTRFVTMQTIYNDGGYHRSSLTNKMIKNNL